MSDIICIPCSGGDESVEFPNMMELKKHEMLGHTTRWQKPLPQDPRGDHPSATELAKKEEPKIEKEKKPTEPQEQPLPLKPLALQYQYEGQCPKCRDKVKTIEVEVGEHNLIVAYCVRCDNKLMQRKVIPINKQFLKASLEEPDTFESRLKGKR